MAEKNFKVAYGEIIAKCWEDEKFKAEFIENPEAKLEEANFPIEEGITYKVIEAPKMTRYIVLPRENTKAAVQEVAKLFLNKVEQTNTLIPAGFEVRMIQDTEDVNYLILPASPKTLTAAELSAVAGGDSTTVATDSVTHAEVATMAVEAQTVATTTTSVAEAEMAVVVAAACVLI